MSAYEYKVVPAPSRGEKARGVKGAEARFAYALERVMNKMAGDGWTYVRAETLPHEERQGLTSFQTTYRNVLVFRRERAEDISAYKPRLIEKQDTLTVAPQPIPVEKVKPAAELRSRSGLPAEDTGPTTLPAVPNVLQARAARLRRGTDDLAAE